ncbi:protein LONGIFOLIA 1-like [Zingiber officinale]|uniref:protein LONGIFOLIA 1-like n=1 Tax=Zingiber officinale TaxID=94328 RepID=UPI001C4D8882|nr:protein LONGIFOLIA 1-like [Zingiber officinale]
MLVEMTPGVVSHGGVLEEQRLERQIGCMAGFLHLFDRGHIVVGRRGFSARRLTTASIAGSSSPSTRSDSSSPSLLKESQPPPPSSPEVYPSSPESRAGTPARRLLPLTLQIFEAGEGGKTSCRIRDGPRLSLDSRAVLDAKGKLHPRQIRTADPVNTGAQSDASEAGDEQRRSPSVVARLMGLEGFPSHRSEGGAEPVGAKLQRSASESRIRKDLSCYGFVGVSSMHNAHPGPAGSEPISAEEFFKSVSLAKFKLNNTTKAMPPSKNGPLPPLQRKIFFDAEDIFPESKRPGTLYGEIEKRLRMRGIDEPAKDMETVKQILEVLHLKGLLHSNPSPLVGGCRNPYSNQCLTHEGAPIVIMKSTTKALRGRTGESPLLLPKIGAAPQSPSLVRRERTPVDSLLRGNERRNRAPKSPESPSSPVNRRPQNEVAHRRSQPQRRTSPIVSPKSSPKILGPDFLAARSPRSRRPTNASSEDRVYSPAEDDTSTTFFENRAIVSSQYDFVRSKAEEYRPERNLLERCDKLLHNIAAFTGAEQSTASDLQPSPVSVLDSLAFLGEEGSPSPSPLSKRSIDFKDLLTDDREESQWSSTESTIEGDANGGLEDGDPDYRYVCEVVRACDRYGDACAAVYAVLEKRREAIDSCKADRLHRRLLFDTVTEILDQTRRVSPWDAFSPAMISPPAPGEEEVPPRQVWTDIRGLREQALAVEECGMDDAAVGRAVRKDINRRLSDGWSRPGPEMSDAVLDIERLVFKDLVAEAIRDLAAASATARRLVPRRKLEF